MIQKNPSVVGNGIFVKDFLFKIFSESRIISTLRVPRFSFAQFSGSFVAREGRGFSFYDWTTSENDLSCSLGNNERGKLWKNTGLIKKNIYI